MEEGKWVTLHVRVERWVANRIDEAAKKIGLNRSDYVRMSVAVCADNELTFRKRENQHEGFAD